METLEPGYIYNHRFTAHSSPTDNGVEGFTLWESTHVTQDNAGRYR